MKKNYLQPNQTNRPTLKWIFYGILIILFISFIFTIVFYSQIEKRKTTGFSETKSQVLDKTEVTTINKIERFHGEDAYHIVYGQTSDGHQVFVFVPISNESKDMLTVDQSEIIAKEKVKSIWAEQCDDCKIKKITPGIVEDDFVWELTYIDGKNRYVFDYVSLYDGDPYELLRFKQLFK